MFADGSLKSKKMKMEVKLKVWTDLLEVDTNELPKE